MRRILVRSAVAVFAFLALASARVDVAARRDAPAAAAQFGDSQCVAGVPKAWGQYRGGSAQSGLAFEDANGTLRFLTNIPCGSATPTVALEIRRTGNSN
jgi:hypothetical protein